MPARGCVAALERVVVIAVQVRMPELAHRVDDRQQRLALASQLVLDAGRGLRIAVPLDDALALERPEPLGQRPRADAAAGALELGEPARALGEVVDQEGGPLGPDDLRRGGHAAGGGLVDGVHRAVHVPNCTCRYQTWR